MKPEDYILVRELSRGATGATTIILRSGHKRVLKKALYVSDAGLRLAAALRLRNESRILSQLGGEFTPRLLSYTETDSLPNIEMEFCEGGSLDRQLSLKAFKLQHLDMLTHRLLEALHRMHQLGYVHRDVKPANILSRKNGEFVLADFELATPLTRWRDTREQAGTLLYCSPEQLGLVSHPVSYNSDLFSLGIVLFQAVSDGRHPFSEGNEANYLQKLRDATNLTIPPQVPANVSKLIAALLEKDPSSRLASCEDAAAILGIPLSAPAILPGKDTDSVAQLFLGPAQIDETLGRQLEALTDRSVKEITSLLEQCLQKGLLRFDDNRWYLPEESLASMIDVPEFLAYALRRKASMQVAQMESWSQLAQVPIPLTDELTASVLQTSRDAARALLRQGTQEGILHVKDSEYRFSNDMLRHAMAQDVTDTRRREVNERTLQFAHEAGIPARHLAQLAHDTDAHSVAAPIAYQVLTELGRDCVISGQSDEAVRHLTAARILDATRFATGHELLKGLADSLQLVGRTEEAEKLYLELFEQQTEPEDKARSMIWASRTAVRRLEWDSAGAYVDKGLALISADTSNMAVVKEASHFFMSRMKKENASKATDVELELANIRGYLAFFQMDQPRLLSSFLRIARLVETATPSYEALNGWMNVSALWSALGWKKESIRCITRAREVSLALNTPQAILSREYFDGYSADERGDFTYSREIFLKRGTEMINHLSQNERAMVAGIILFHHLLMGNVQKADEIIQLFDQKQKEDRLPPCLEVLPFKLGWQTLTDFPSMETRREIMARLDKAPTYRRIMTEGLLVWSDAMKGEYDLARCERLMKDMKSVSPFSIYFAFAAWGSAMAYVLAYEAKAIDATTCEKAIHFFKKHCRAPELKMYAHLLKGRFLWQRGEKTAGLSEVSKAELLYFGRDFPLFDAELAWTRFVMARTGLDDLKALSRLAFSNMSAAKYAQLTVVAQRYQPYVEETNLADKSLFAGNRTKTLFGKSLMGSASFSSAESELLKLQLDSLTQLSASVATEFEPHRHAQLVLQETLKAIGGERAFIFKTGEQGDLQLFAGRDKEGNEIPASGISESLVRRVQMTRSPQTVSVSNGQEVDFSQSIQENSIRSVVCAPLLLRDQLLGILYVDSRIIAGVYNDNSVRLLESIASQMAISMETTRAARIEKERAALEKDLQVTGAVQKLLLPLQSTKTQNGYWVCGQSTPAVQSGGDWWWYQFRPDGKLWVTLGDVTGHGAGSAMVASLLTGAYHAQSHKPSTPEDILGDLHRVIHQTCGSNFSATFAFLEIDTTQHVVTWWNCSGPPVFLATRDTITPHVNQGTPLGVEHFELPKPVTFQLQPRDRLLLFSDGLTEAPVQGRPLGMVRLRKKLQQLQEVTAPEVVTETASLVVSPGQPLEDDVTVVLIERLADAPSLH